jgi:hypothetical protein
MKVMLNGIVCLCAFIVLLCIPSCKYATVVTYVHEETEGFYKHLDINMDKLSPYKINNVLFAPYFIGATHTTSIVGLRIYSEKQGASGITVDKVALYKNSEKDNAVVQKKNNQEIIFNKTFQGSEIYQTVICLFEEIDNSILEDISQKSEIELAIYFSVNASNKIIQKRIVYTFQREKTTFLIQR